MIETTRNALQPLLSSLGPPIYLFLYISHLGLCMKDAEVVRIYVCDTSGYIWKTFVQNESSNVPRPPPNTTHLTHPRKHFVYTADFKRI